MLISVITPVYKGGDNLLTDFIKKYAYLQSEWSQDEFELIFVLDGSVDNNPAQIAKHIKDNNLKNAKYIAREQNFGKGYSVREGFSNASGQYLCFIDFDPEVPLKYIALMYQKLRDSDDGLCTGDRFDKQSVYKVDFLRKLLSRGFWNLNKILFGIHFPDSQAGLKMIKRDVYDKVKEELNVNGFAFDIELIRAVQRAGYGISNIPIEYVRDGNISTIKVITPIKMALESIRIWKKEKKRKKE